MAMASPRTSRHSRHIDRKSTRLNSSHSQISYAVFCLKKKKQRIEKEEIRREHDRTTVTVKYRMASVAEKKKTGEMKAHSGLHSETTDQYDRRALLDH